MLLTEQLPLAETPGMVADCKGKNKQKAKQLEMLRQAKKPDAERLFQQGYQQLELFHHQLKQQLLYLEAHMNVNRGCRILHVNPFQGVLLHLHPRQQDT